MTLKGETSLGSSKAVRFLSSALSSSEANVTENVVWQALGSPISFDRLSMRWCRDVEELPRSLRSDVCSFRTPSSLSAMCVELPMSSRFVSASTPLSPSLKTELI